jgi:hypothetical protein
MGKIIRKGAAAGAILRDLGIVKTRSQARGAPYVEDSARFLDATLAQAAAYASRLAAIDDELATLRAEQDVACAAADALVARIKDDAFNRIGRSANDPLFDELFPAGKSTYTDITAARKPTALRLLASVLETSKHEVITAAVVAPYVVQIRAAATAIEVLNTRALPILANRDLVRAQYASSARTGQVQLSRLKKHWRSIGRSEAAIHQIIPDRPTTAGSTVPETASSLSDETAADVTAANVVDPTEVRIAAK